MVDKWRGYVFLAAAANKGLWEDLHNQSQQSSGQSTSQPIVASRYACRLY